MLKAIETKYKGYRFRSRLEARCAVFFDALGIEWEYEKEGYELPSGWYLPDFWLPKLKLWIECKGERPTEDEQSKALDLHKATGFKLVFLVNTFSHNSGMTIPVPDDGSFSIEFTTFHEDIDITYYNRFFVRGTEYGYLACPKCGGDYVRNTPGTNEFYGECGHSWEYVFNLHKGQTYITATNIKETETIHGLLVFSRGDKQKLDSAIEAARSARFEHGENGAPPKRSWKPDWLK